MFSSSNVEKMSDILRVKLEFIVLVTREQEITIEYQIFILISTKVLNFKIFKHSIIVLIKKNYISVEN